MEEKPSLETEKNNHTIYIFDIPSGDFYNAIATKGDTMNALMTKYKPCWTGRPLDDEILCDKEIFCYETEQQCLDAYDAFHKQIPSTRYIGRGTYIGKGEVYDN